MIRIRFVRCGLLGAGLALLLGCEQKLTYERFRMLHRGVSTRAEVENTLGNPNTRMEEEWLYQKPAEGLTVRIQFDKNGRISGKQWFDSAKGFTDMEEWGDQPPPDGNTVYQGTSVETSHRP